MRNLPEDQFLFLLDTNSGKEWVRPKSFHFRQFGIRWLWNNRHVLIDRGHPVFDWLNELQSKLSP